MSSSTLRPGRSDMSSSAGSRSGLINQSFKFIMIHKNAFTSVPTDSSDRLLKDDLKSRHDERYVDFVGFF